MIINFEIIIEKKTVYFLNTRKNLAIEYIFCSILKKIGFLSILKNVEY